MDDKENQATRSIIADIVLTGLICGLAAGIRLFMLNAVLIELWQVYALFLWLIVYFTMIVGIITAVARIVIATIVPTDRFGDLIRRHFIRGIPVAIMIVFVIADGIRQSFFVTRSLPITPMVVFRESLLLILAGLLSAIVVHTLLNGLNKVISPGRLIVILCVVSLPVPPIVHHFIVDGPYRQQRESMSARPANVATRSENHEQMLAEKSSESLLLFGIDGATWNLLSPLMKMGHCPVMSRLRRQGVAAALSTMKPTLSPVIWTSMATGYLPEQHGILHFARFHIPGIGILPAKLRWPDHTLLKQTIRVSERLGLITPELYTSTLRTKPTFWEIASRAGISVGIVNWWCSWPVSPLNGFIISERFSFSIGESILGGESARIDEIYPESLDAIYRPLIRKPESLTGEEISQFMPLSDEDLTEMTAEERKPWHFSNWFWFRTVHQSDNCLFEISRDLLKKQKPQLFALYHQGIDVVEHHYWHYLEPDAFPSLPRNDIERFRLVIPATYDYEDRVLGQLMDENMQRTVIIVSDHGMIPTGRLPKSADHVTGDPPGIFIAAGQPIVPTRQINDISVLDLSPLLLALLGLPIAEDAAGRVPVSILTDEFLARNPLQSVKTFTRNDENISDSQHSPTDDDLYQKLRGIGYLN